MRMRTVVSRVSSLSIRCPVHVVDLWYKNGKKALGTSRRTTPKRGDTSIASSIAGGNVPFCKEELTSPGCSELGSVVLLSAVRRA